MTNKMMPYVFWIMSVFSTCFKKMDQEAKAKRGRQPSSIAGRSPQSSAEKIALSIACSTGCCQADRVMAKLHYREPLSLVSFFMPLLRLQMSELDF